MQGTVRNALCSELHFLQWSSLHILQKFPTVLTLPQTTPAAPYTAPRDRPERPDPITDQTLSVKVDGSTGQVEHSAEYRLENPRSFSWRKHRLVSAKATLSGLGTDQQQSVVRFSAES